MNIAIPFFVLMLPICAAKVLKLTPVFLIDDRLALNDIPSIKVNHRPAFGYTDEIRFATLLNETTKRSNKIIIFIEDTFSTEDITQKDKHGTSYPYLQGGLRSDTVKYFPAVEDAFETFSKVLPRNKHNQFVVDKTDSIAVEYLDNPYVYVFFEDSSQEPRSETLRRHDEIMQKIHNHAKDSTTGSVVTFYTGRYPGGMGANYDDPDSMLDNSIKIFGSEAKFVFKGVYVKKPKALRGPKYEQQAFLSLEDRRENSMSTLMKYDDFELRFNFRFNKQGWAVDKVELLKFGEVVGAARMTVDAPWYWSYYCAEPLQVVNRRDNSTIVISEYQIQPAYNYEEGPEPTKAEDVFKELDEEEGVEKWEEIPKKHQETSEASPPERMGPPKYCDKVYFSDTILSCLFVTALLVAILTYGVVSLYGCMTNDKMDNPMGKGLVIVLGPGQ